MSLDVYLKVTQPSTVFTANYTHNCNVMASEAGIYKHLWRPDELGITKAHELIEPLTQGLLLMRRDPERFEALNPENGWGSYMSFVPWVQGYLNACIEYPDADVETFWSVGQKEETMSKQETIVKLKQLCEDTLAAIEAAGHAPVAIDFEFTDDGGACWRFDDTAGFDLTCHYRLKPPTRVVYIDFNADEEWWHSEAEFAAASNPGRFTKFIEVIE